MKLAALWNRRQIPDIKVVPDWYVVLGRIDASNYDVTYCFENFLQLILIDAVTSYGWYFIVIEDDALFFYIKK